MFLLKACQKCQGDLYVDQDQFGTFLQCLQCGALKDIKLSQVFDRDTRGEEAGRLPADQLEAMRLSA